MKLRRAIVALGIAALAVLLLVVFRHALARRGIEGVLSLVSGAHVTIGTLHLGRSAAELDDTRAAFGDTEVLRVARIVVRYNLRDLLPGGARRYGLVAVDVERPVVTLHRKKDGSLDFPVKNGAQPSGPAGPAAAGTPLRLTVRVRDGSVTLLDPFRYHTASRRFVVAALRADATIDSAAQTRYTVRAAYESGRAYPVDVSGSIDAQRTTAVHELRVAAIPLTAIVNYFINGPVATLRSGEARNVDMKLFSLGPHGQYHAGGGADLAATTLVLHALQQPVQNLGGHIEAFDDGFATQHLDGALAGLPLRLAGGLFHLAQPSIRLAVRTAGPLERLRTTFAFTARQPVSGDVDLHVLIEGPIGTPLILSRFTSDGAAYRGLPIARFGGTVAYYDEAATLLPFTARYGSIDVTARGAFLIGTHLITELALAAHAPASGVPYAAQIVPGATIDADGLLGGLDGAFSTRGVVYGAGGGDSLDGLFAIDARGNGRFGPVLVSRADGSSLVGDFYQARSASRSAVLIDARHFTLAAPATPPKLPGLPQLAPPNFGGVLDASIVGIGPPSAFVLAGRGSVHGLTVGGVHIAAADARILGTLTDARLSEIHADGPWGTFAGNGGYDGSDLALQGDYRGSFAALRPLTGDLDASGAIAAPVGLVVGGDRVVVQTRGASTPGATVHGIGIDGLTGTLAAGKGGVRVYAAQVRVGGAELGAGGTIAPGRSIGLAIADADARALRPLGVPLDGGRVSAVGSAAVSAGGLAFDGGALVTRGRYDKLPVAGNGDVRFAGTQVRFGRVDGRVATVFGGAQGDLSAVGSRAPRYDVAVRVRGSDLGDLVKAFGHDPYHLDGSADADLHVGGAGAEPVVTGRVHLPEATINGLFIDNAWADVHALPSSVALESGAAQVGSTHATFGGAVQGKNIALSVESKQADLSDFNGFFDPGDFMSGKGHVDFGFEYNRRSFAATSGDIAMQGLRVLHFDFGDASSRWTSSNSRVSGDAQFAGRLGAFDANGAIVLATRAPLPRMVRRSRFDLKTSGTGLDVGALLAAAGYDLPFGGEIDAAGTIRGRYPALAVSGTASLRDGVIEKLPVDRLTVSATSTVSRATITDAEIEIGSITARGSGSFGFAPNAPLQLALHASSPNIGTVVAKLTGNTMPVAGSFETDVHVTGDPTAPKVEGGFDVESGQVAGVAIPRALGEFTVAGRSVELRDAEVAFATGTLYVAGSIPLTVAPFGFGPPNAPLALDARAQGIGLNNFVPLLPKGSLASGTLDGHLGARGTVAAPALQGELALAGGQLQFGGLEGLPLRNVSGHMTFAGTSARLESLHADAGGGRIDATGSASVPDLMQPGVDGTYDLRIAFVRAVLNLPAYGRGQIDGALTFAHAPGQLGVVGGNLALQDAVIPFSALYNPGSGSSNSSPFALDQTATTPYGLPNVAFDLSVAAAKSVRVRSSVIDIGGAGGIHIGGTLADPSLAGAFTSTGGTLTYFNTVFRLLDGSVTFQPDQGIVPILDARASTHVINPDPNAQRNPTGSADITLSVRGPVSNLNISLDSNPAYDRQQILGLLLSAPAIGATNLFTPPPTPGAPPTPTLTTTPTQSGAITVAQEAFGFLNAQFTRSLLAPVESAFGGALGLSDVNLTFDYTGGVGVSARKLLGRNVYAVYGTTFGYPYRQTFGFELRPTPTTAAQFTFYETIGEVYGYLVSPITGAVSRETLSQPITGQSGFSFSLQRFFW